MDVFGLAVGSEIVLEKEWLCLYLVDRLVTGKRSVRTDEALTYRRDTSGRNNCLEMLDCKVGYTDCSDL